MSHNPELPVQVKRALQILQQIQQVTAAQLAEMHWCHVGHVMEGTQVVEIRVPDLNVRPVTNKVAIAAFDTLWDWSTPASEECPVVRAADRGFEPASQEHITAAIAEVSARDRSSRRTQRDRRSKRSKPVTRREFNSLKRSHRRIRRQLAKRPRSGLGVVAALAMMSATPESTATAPWLEEAVTSWQAAAVVLGVSPTTLRRRRQERNDDSEPWWASAADCQSWYDALVHPAASPPADKTERRPRRAKRLVRPGLTLADFRKRKSRSRSG